MVILQFTFAYDRWNIRIKGTDFGLIMGADCIGIGNGTFLWVD